MSELQVERSSERSLHARRSSCPADRNMKINVATCECKSRLQPLAYCCVSIPVWWSWWWSPADSASQIREDALLTRMCVYCTLQTRFLSSLWFSAGWAPACLLKQIICIKNISENFPWSLHKHYHSYWSSVGLFILPQFCIKPSCLVLRGFPVAECLKALQRTTKSMKSSLAFIRVHSVLSFIQRTTDALLLLPWRGNCGAPFS